MNVYYVYKWVNPKTLEVFYVGKGKYAKCYNRAYNKHHAGRCENKRSKLLQQGYTNDDIIRIVADNLSEADALAIETQLINEYGVLEDGGTLFNFRKNGTKAGSYQKYRERDVALMIETYEQGYTLKEIGEMYNVHECTIRKYLLDKGIKLRRQGYTVPRPENWPEILNDLKTGMSATKVSKKYMICAPTLKRLIADHPA